MHTKVYLLYLNNITKYYYGTNSTFGTNSTIVTMVNTEDTLLHTTYCFLIL